MSVNRSELAVGKEIKIRGDGSSWEIVELGEKNIRARNTTTGHVGLIPTDLIIGIVNKAVSGIPVQDIQIIDKADSQKKKRVSRKPRKKKITEEDDNTDY
jgi:hypothetical protein